MQIDQTDRTPENVARLMGIRLVAMRHFHATGNMESYDTWLECDAILDRWDEEDNDY